MTNFQRIGSISNTHVGNDFEETAVAALAAAGIRAQPRFSVPVGVGGLKKEHRFDFGSADPPVLVECKCHRWTTGGNAPSAKLTVWNEAMYYFAIAPHGYRRIFFVLRDYSPARRQTLAEHYLSRYRHLVPEGVEFWEYDEAEQCYRVLDTGIVEAAPAAVRTGSAVLSQNTGGGMTKYQPLQEYLAARREKSHVRLTFAEIASIIGDVLPESAFKYREWWANQSDTTSRPQAAAWLGAGFVVDAVHQESGSGWTDFVRR